MTSIYLYLKYLPSFITISSGYQQPAAPSMLIPSAVSLVQKEPEIGHSAMNQLPPNVAHGWNDPPVFTKPARTQQVYFDILHRSFN